MPQSLPQYTFQPLPTADYKRPLPSDFEYLAITSNDHYRDELIALQALEARLFPDAESLNHYQTMLERNTKKGEQYVVLAARHKQTKEVGGAIIFQTFLCPYYMVDQFGIGATCANYFTFADRKFQANGLGNALLIERKKHIDGYIDEQNRGGFPFSVHHEIAGELKLTVAEHLRIRSEDEYCPFKRGDFWGNRGQRALESIEYVIPETSEIPVRRYYIAHMNTDHGAPSALLDFHFTVSISACYLNGADPRDNDDFRYMQKEVLSHPFHPTVDRRGFIKGAKQVTDQLLSGSLSETELKQPLGLVLKAHYPQLFS